MAISTTWDSSFEIYPAGTTDPRYIDDSICALKVGIRERFELEHVGKISETSAGHGWHREGSAKAYWEASAPTYRPDGVTALTSDDAGRIWIDSDNNRINIRTASAWSSALNIDDLTIGDDLTVTDAMTVGGATTFNGAVTYNNSFTITDLTVGDDLIVTDSTSLRGPVSMTSNYGSSVLNFKIYEFPATTTEDAAFGALNTGVILATDYPVSAIGNFRDNDGDLRGLSYIVKISSDVFRLYASNGVDYRDINNGSSTILNTITRILLID